MMNFFIDIHALQGNRLKAETSRYSDELMRHIKIDNIDSIKKIYEKMIKILPLHQQDFKKFLADNSLFDVILVYTLIDVKENNNNYGIPLFYQQMIVDAKTNTNDIVSFKPVKDIVETIEKINQIGKQYSNKFILSDAECETVKNDIKEAIINAYDYIQKQLYSDVFVPTQFKKFKFNITNKIDEINVYEAIELINNDIIFSNQEDIILIYLMKSYLLDTLQQKWNQNNYLNRPNTKHNEERDMLFKEFIHIN